jgi:hypothetical protein
MIKAKNYLLCMLLLGVLISPGCQILGPEEGSLDDLSAKQSTWSEWSGGTYSFVVFRGCFCAWGGAVWIQVMDQEITAAFLTERNEPVPPEHFNELHTIDELFDMIQRAEREADEIEVEWADEGYPSHVFIDWIEEAIDDELFLEISSVVPGIAQID